MERDINVKTILWNTASEHHDLYEAIDNILYIIKSDKIRKTADFKPFKIDMGIIFICQKGSMDFSVDMMHYQMKEREIFIVLPGQIVEYENFSPDWGGITMLFSSEFYKSISFPISLPLVLFDYNAPVIHMNEEQMRILNSFCGTIIEISESSIPNKKEVFKYLCISLILSYKTEIQDYQSKGTESDKVLGRKFLHLLIRNFKIHKDIGFYADELNLSKKYFSVLIKKETGKSVAEWIDTFIVLEAKKLLATTDLTIQQISIELNFCNQSFFGKFFKRMTGMSPKQYRGSLLSL